MTLQYGQKSWGARSWLNPGPRPVVVAWHYYLTRQGACCLSSAGQQEPPGRTNNHGKIYKIRFWGVIIIALLFVAGCASSGGYSSHTYYRSYHDPYPYWGRRDVYIYHGDRRPRPPGVKPPRPPSIGRPSQLPTKPRPQPTPRPSPQRAR